MMLASSRLALLSTLLLAACSSVSLSPLPATDPANRAEVLIFRVYAFNAGGLSLAVGMGNEAFAKLENSEYVVALVAAGNADFFVQVRTAEPTRVRVNLKAGDEICLKTEADPENLGKVLLPPALMATGYRFTLAHVVCPSEAELLNYKRVSATYRPT
jgi:hypothetical protein